jgi:multicomponent Na+:H+ antiporter subunit D
MVPLFVVLTSLLTGVFIFMAGERRDLLRTILNISGALLKLLFIGWLLLMVLRGTVPEFRLAVLPELDLLLRFDALSMLFSTLSAVLWLVTTIYAIGYLKPDAGNRARFFGFFSLCVAATMGIASAGNLFTFFIFYELLTLATWPLVTHNGSREARSAGRVYLTYTLGGSALFLGGLVWLYGIGGPQDYIAGGSLASWPAERRGDLIIIFLLLMFGMGVKAALFPLHAWLPRAMVAPAPVSALLHAVAVVKAGAFGLIRMVYDVFGPNLVQELRMDRVLAVMAAVTILYGSLMALRQTEIKRLLAYSTVSQISYIILGIAVGGPLATVGGLVHLVHQGLMKITLFFCAGDFAQTGNITRIKHLDGLGRRLPWSAICFTVGALGMIGIPPMAGFISKWYLGLGALADGQPWVVVVLLVSASLNAAYFLPLLYRIWFVTPGDAAPLRSIPMMLFPTLFTAFLAIVTGLFAGLPMSPLYWVQLIVETHYR